MCTKDPEKGTFEITIQATKPGELWCYHPIRLPAYRKTPPDKATKSVSVFSSCVGTVCLKKTYNMSASPSPSHTPSGLPPELNCKVSNTKRLQLYSISSSVLQGQGPFCPEQKSAAAAEGVLLCCNSRGLWPKGEYVRGLCCCHTVPMFRASLP